MGCTQSTPVGSSAADNRSVGEKKSASQTVASQPVEPKEEPKKEEVIEISDVNAGIHKNLSSSEYEKDCNRMPKFHPAEKRNERFSGLRGLPRGPMTELLMVMNSATTNTLDEVRSAMRKVQDADVSDTSCVANRSIGKDGMTCLHYAVGVCDSSVVALLMSLGGNPNKRDDLGRNALHHLARLHMREKDTKAKIVSISKVSVVLPMPTGPGYDYEGDGSAASRAAHEHMLRIALCTRKKFDIHSIEWNVLDDFKRTPLHYAAENGNMQLVQHLVNTFKVKLQILDSTLKFAVEVARSPLVKRCIQAAIDKDADNSQFMIDRTLSLMLFHMPALIPKEMGRLKREELERYRILVSGTAPGVKGVRVHSVDEVTYEGQTALHYASSRNTIEHAEYLLKYEANPLIRDNFGQLPIDLASTSEMKELLQAAMGESTASSAPSGQAIPKSVPAKSESESDYVEEDIDEEEDDDEEDYDEEDEDEDEGADPNLV